MVPGTIDPGDRLDLDVGPDDPDVALRPIGAAPDRQHDRRAGLAPNPADHAVEVLARRSICRRRQGRRPRTVSPASSAGLARKTPTIERQALGRRVDHRPDADVGARQRRVPGSPLLRRHERRMARVADRVGHAVDRAVRELAIVERVGVDIVLLDRVPRLADERELVARRRRGRWIDARNAPIRRRSVRSRSSRSRCRRRTPHEGDREQAAPGMWPRRGRGVAGESGVGRSSAGTLCAPV